MTAINHLLSELVDYAGLFPPASLPLEQVVQNYTDYRQGSYAWMLARLILPVGQLAELERLEAFRNSSDSWRISALVPAVDAADQAFAQAMHTIAGFNKRHSGGTAARAVVDTIEVKAGTLQQVEQTMAAVPSDLNVFMEIPHRPLQPNLVERIGKTGKRMFAKIRTGGVTENLIPGVTEVAEFIHTCARFDAGFKATAGLHHPLRGRYRLTYDDQPEQGTMFGFVNVFAAACIAFGGHASVDVLQDILTESDPHAFRFNQQNLAWREQHVPAGEVRRIRSEKAIAFGSCSFDEPTDELEALGWLSQAEVG